MSGRLPNGDLWPPEWVPHGTGDCTCGDGGENPECQHHGYEAVIARLSQQLQSAVDALRFYADPKTWDTLSPHGYVTANTLARQDGGERARRALGGQPDA